MTPPNISVKPKRNADDYTPAGGVHRKVGVKEAWYDEPTQGEPNEDPDTGQAVASHEQRVDTYVKAWEIAAFAGSEYPMMNAVETVEVSDVSKTGYELAQTQNIKGRCRHEIDRLLMVSKKLINLG